jgi:hypothetical protein
LHHTIEQSRAQHARQGNVSSRLIDILTNGTEDSIDSGTTLMPRGYSFAQLKSLQVSEHGGKHAGSMQATHVSANG